MAISNFPPQQSYMPQLQQPPQSEEALILLEMDEWKKHYGDPAIPPHVYYKRMDDLASRLHHVRQAAALNATHAQQAYQMQMYQQSALNRLMVRPVSISAQTAPVPREDAFGETLAWRVWKVGAFPFLTSAFKTDFIWSPGVIELAEGVSDHNQHGFHAWNNVNAARLYCIEVDDVCVVGQVKLWGTVIHHEKGYRAEKAKIVSLDTLSYPTYSEGVFKDAQRYPHIDVLIDNIRKHYGLPVGGTK